jgi:hypothetical protein
MAEAGPREAVLGAGAGGPLTAPSPWIQYQGWVQYPAAVVIGSPTGGQKGLGTLNLQALYLNGVIVNLAQYVLLVGGTMTGFLTLSADPTSSLHAVTKQYVDNQVNTINGNLGGYLPLTGGTVTGPITMTSGFLTLTADPNTALQAATKQYVDTKIAGLIGVPDAPADGTGYWRNNNTWSNSLDLGTF